MRTIHPLSPELLEVLEPYRAWVFSDATQRGIVKRLCGVSPRLKREGRPEAACAVETLVSIDADTHEGFPLDFHGMDLNYKNVQNESAQFDPSFFDEVRRVNHDLDGKLIRLLGARSCALKAFYPAGGYIAWHTNWNAPGYMVLFTYSESGRGYWRHIDPSGSASPKPDPTKLVHIDDIPGWHCKVGYFGAKRETDRLLWHSAFSQDRRITLSYLVQDEAVWRDMVKEIAEASALGG